MKKAFLFSLVIVLVFSLSSCAKSENSVSYGATGDMEVGDVVYVGNIAIERAPDDAQLDQGTQAEEFSIIDFAGNTSLNQTLALNKTYRYFRILVRKTTDQDIKVSIGDDHVVAIQFPAVYLYAVGPWEAKAQTESFSCDSGLYGSAQAILCASSDEAQQP